MPFIFKRLADSGVASPLGGLVVVGAINKDAHAGNALRVVVEVRLHRYIVAWTVLRRSGKVITPVVEKLKEARFQRRVKLLVSGLRGWHRSDSSTQEEYYLRRRLLAITWV